MRNQLRDGFGSLVARAARQWRRAVDGQLRPLGLTEATWLPLLYLARAEAPGRQKDLAAALGLDGSSVVRLLDSLQAAGLVERREEDTDRRSKIITPTGRGLAIIEQAETASRAVRDATLAGLSDEELRTASHVLEVICRNLAEQQRPDE